MPARLLSCSLPWWPWTLTLWNFALQLKFCQ
ncbi:rCG27155, isoform CRA_a [Rattus norvegicus]|uniref:RCG27155, isoform CRA_a n=1 Tax=Rattus norvegicus TaxID=10116 RepID=A6HPV9_RAT|nr:rCG27155, isoform CRA_a [Rattus norvegicus]